MSDIHGTVYVSASGDDSTQATVNPVFKTMTKAVSVNPDKIIVLDGEYPAADPMVFNGIPIEIRTGNITTGLYCGRLYDSGANGTEHVSGSPDSPEDIKITDNSVELRVEEHIQAINAFLSILCLQIGFSAGTFTFDQHSGIKTATEVISENSKTYKTIKTLQNQLTPAIERLVQNIIDVAVLYGMQHDGQSVESLAAGGYHVSVTFDDGVTQDRQTNLNEGVMLVGAGLLSKYSFLTDPKYGQGLTPEQAEAELARIKAEDSTAQSYDVTRLFGGA